MGYESLNYPKQAVNYQYFTFCWFCFVCENRDIIMQYFCKITFVFSFSCCCRKNLTPVRLLPYIVVLVTAWTGSRISLYLLPVTASQTTLNCSHCHRQLLPHSSTSHGSSSTFPTSPYRFWETRWRDPQHFFFK